MAPFLVVECRLVVQIAVADPSSGEFTPHFQAAFHRSLDRKVV